MAKKMGLPVQHFLAATNANDIVPKYLHTGIFSPRPSTPTLSNAMDVGNPSNFPRMLDLFPETNQRSTWNMITERILGFRIPIPERLASLEHTAKRSTFLKADFLELKSFLLDKTNKK